jgi:isocitrate dehydrogenase (NAD+)
VSQRVVVLPGDGIGPDVVAAARRAVDATGAAVEWDAHESYGDGVLAAARESGVVLKGPVAAVRGGRSPNLELRAALGLELGVRPSRGHGRDVVVTRMLAGDLYAGIEFDAEHAGPLRELAPRLPADAAVALKPISRAAVSSAARIAFAWARDHRRERVTIVHKATVMPATDGLFLDAAREVGRDFPMLTVDDRLVDAVCHDLITGRDPLDVLFAPMLYGDILSDVCAGLTGGLGFAPGVNLGPGCAVFEAVHGTAKRHAGRGTASPIALIRSAAMLLEHVGEGGAARRLDAAADAVAQRPPAGTQAQLDAVLAAL